MIVKPYIPVDLVCIDTTPKVALAERAIHKSLEQANFKSVKLLTNDATRKHAVKIPALNGLEAYSNFMVRELHKYVESSHALVCQWDGYVLNGSAWSPEFLKYDYIGAPFQRTKAVGNGGFSLRSKRMLQMASRMAPSESAHPEDSWLCLRHRKELESAHRIQFAPYEVAFRFSFEGRAWAGREWEGTPTHWQSQLGFHSWLSVLPKETDKPLVFHHSGDAGDVLYGLPVIKALGGGVLFLSGDNRYPYPRPTRWQQQGAPADWASSLGALLEQQPYIWRCLFTHGLPYSTDIDLNSFREFYRTNRAENFDSLFSLHQRAAGVSWPEDVPWLEIETPRIVPDRPIIVNRTARFHNDAFPWSQLVAKYGRQMAFVGTLQEHAAFYHWGNVPWIRTENLLEVAQLIAGAKVFIGNQSCPMAIALGLGKNVIQEVWLGNRNCRLKRNNVIYWESGPLDIPKEWL